MTRPGCVACGSELTPPATKTGFAFCSKCGLPRLFGDEASPFDVLGVPISFVLDEAALQTRYYELSRLLHPDRFAAAASSPDLRAQSLKFSAVLNQAYLALREPENRLETLLSRAGALIEGGRAAAGGAQLPAELAEEYFELQEALMEDPASARDRAKAFRGRLEEQRTSLTTRMFEEARKVEWPATSAPGANIEKILEMRRQRSYVRSMLEDLVRRGL